MKSQAPAKEKSRADKFKASNIGKNAPKKGASSGEAEASDDLAKVRLVEMLSDPKNHRKKINVQLELLRVADNTRPSLGDLTSLMLQIEEKKGLISPISIQVKDGEPTVTAGHRRHACYLQLYKSDPELYGTISCMIEVYPEESADDERLLTQAIENLGRLDQSPLVECITIGKVKNVLERKHGRDISHAELASFFGGRHIKTIGLSLKISAWPKEVHDYISANETIINISKLRNIAKRTMPNESLLPALREIVTSARANADNSEVENDERSEVIEANDKVLLKRFKKALQLTDDPDLKRFLSRNRTILLNEQKRDGLKQFITTVFPS